MRRSSSRILTRRAVVQAGVLGIALTPSLSFAEPSLAGSSPAGSSPTVDEAELVRQMFGQAAALSPRVHLGMPASFANGFSVPMDLAVDSPMTEGDFVRAVHVLAPKNPIIPVATFAFTPQSGRVAIATRIRLAAPQAVLAVAELSDGSWLMTRQWVEVETDGCN